MKKTPEQKAFYEYGKARGILKEVRFQMISMEYDEKRYHKLSKAICDAWQKRAACRRTCGQCAHFSPEEWGLGKDGCLKRHCGVKSDRCAAGCLYWEPRKEGE